MKVYNTLKRKKEEFRPLHEGMVNMYVCGPTVYNYISIGNARPVVVFNMARNYLEFIGYKVNYVQNITDIEDKIIKKANEEGLDYREITARYIDAFLEDIRDLEVGGFSAMPKATEMIAEIIDIIGRIMQNGYAYRIRGNVYFDVGKFPRYGRLSGQKIEEMKGTGESDFEKRNPIDFALWKEAKEGEPWWDSPWGKGRPGWHIECSAMATKLLSHTIDIHGGGIDLVFPHHENEIAQSEAAFEESGDFVRYWMHNGMIEVKDEKISKSLGLKEDWILKNLLKKYSPNVIKLYMLSTHYRSPLEFSRDKLEEAKKSLEKITNTLKNIRFLKEESTENGYAVSSGEMVLNKALSKFEEDFSMSMDNDFNSAGALASIFEFIREINSIIQSPDFNISLAFLNELDMAEKGIIKLSSVLGINLEREPGLSGLSIMGDKEENVPSKKEIEKLIEEREAARQKRDFGEADRIREHLYSKGIILEDRKEGTIWKYRERPV
ncbi:MAG: cysteine--tRNA ligase [Actinobacteria bacterium]|nr:cysteine--tRNA ligase [Actinomycetota bacterium]